MPRSLPADDELLRPTLAAADDPVHMRGAWNPWTLAVLAVLGGPLAAGYLFAENARRLGKREHFAPILAAGLVLLLVGSFVAARLRPLETFADWSDTSLQRLVQRACAALLAALFGTLQARRFRVFTGNGGEPGQLLFHGIVAVFVVSWIGALIGAEVTEWAS